VPRDAVLARLSRLGVLSATREGNVSKPHKWLSGLQFFGALQEGRKARVGVVLAVPLCRRHDVEDVVLVALLRQAAASDPRQAAIKEQAARREVVPDWELLGLEHGFELSRAVSVDVKDDRNRLDSCGVHGASIRQPAPEQRSDSLHVADFLTPRALQVGGEHASQAHEQGH